MTTDCLTRLIRRESAKNPGPVGQDGNTPYLQNGNWWIDGVDTGIAATGPVGPQGVPGDIANDPERTYEKSYADSVAPGTATVQGAFWHRSLNYDGSPRHKLFRVFVGFTARKTAVPQLTIYDLAGNINAVSTGVGDSQTYTIISLSERGFLIEVDTGTTSDNWLALHYVAQVI